MAATIKIKNSSTTGAVPTSSDLVQGELAVNVTDLGLYTENASGTVVKLNAPSIDDKNTGATKHLTISTGGNLGLGVTPAAKFHLLSTGSTSADGIRLTLGSEARVHNIYSDLSTGRDLLVAPYRSLTIKAGAGTTEGEVRLQSYESTIFYTGSAYSERMRLDSSGNLGIGTTSPTTRLDVRSSGNTIYASGGSGSGNYGVYGVHGRGGYLISGYYDGTTDWSFYGNSNGYLSGNLLVGKTAVTYTTNGVTLSNGGCNFSATSLAVIAVNRNGTDGSAIDFYKAGTQVGSIGLTGSATAYNTSSDYRLKENIAPMTGALATVAQLKPVTYTWKADGSSGQGFIAHELQEVVPDCVTGEKDAVDADGNPVYQGIDTSFLVATLTAAIQELNAKFEAYKAAHP